MLASVLLTTTRGDDTASHAQHAPGAFLTAYCSPCLERASLAQTCEVATVLVCPTLCWCQH